MAEMKWEMNSRTLLNANLAQSPLLIIRLPESCQQSITNSTVFLLVYLSSYLCS